MSQPIVLFATPSLEHKVSLDYLRSWTNTVWALKDRGIVHGCNHRGGDCFVAKVRSKIVTDFLNSQATDLFFLDDDISWPAEKVIEFIERPEAILAGAYPKKSDKIDWPVALGADLETGDLIESQGLFKAEFAGTGFMRIKREVLERLYPKAPPFQEIEANGETFHSRAVFNSGPAGDGWWRGEDVEFCRNAIAEGFDVWVDPNIAFGHRGTKRWEGSLSDHLDTFRTRAKQAVEKIKEAA